MIGAGASHENRQDLLATLFQDNRYREITLIQTEYEGEPAIQLQDVKTKTIVGWIPKDCVDDYRETAKMVGVIMYHAGRNYYNMSLSQPMKPTRKEYHYVKSLCQKMNVSMPFYDRRAYTEFFAKLRSNNNDAE